MEEDDSVPLHLLQPQRDLVANWSVDVARELQAYLEQLARVFDDGSLCNFAKAALVLQGSIQVYSRKVEHLYNLVLQALDVVAQKGKATQQDKSSQQADGNDADVGEEYDEDDFLNVDIPEVSNIDLNDVDNGACPLIPAAKPPACLLVVEGDSRDTSGEAGELGAYQLVTSILHRDFLLLDPSDTASVDVYLGFNGGRKNSPLSGYVRTPRGGSLVTPGKKHGSAGKARTPRSAQAAPTEEHGKPEAFAPMDHDFPEAPPSPEHAGSVHFEWPDNSMDHDDSADDLGEGGASSPGKEEEANPWVPLNPHEMGSLLVKPYKRGENMRKEKAPAKKRGTGPLLEMSVATMSGLSFPELGKLLAGWQQESKKCDDPYVERYEQLRASFMVRGSTPPESPPNEYTCDDGSGEPNSYDVNEDDGDFGNDADDLGDVEVPGFPVMSSPGSEGVDPPPPPAESQDVKAQDMSFEDLCQAHVDSIFMKLEDFEERTELATRVSTWKQTIDVTLDEQENRAPFDIHVYGERLLGNLSVIEDDEAATPGESRPFADLVQGQDSYEVARSFSALLQLVNNRNVDIQRPGSQRSAPVCYTADKCFSVTMLTTRKQHEELLQHMVPSTVEPNQKKVKRKGNRQALQNISNTHSPALGSASLGKRRPRQSTQQPHASGELSSQSNTPPSRRKRPPLAYSGVAASTPGRPR